MRLESTTSTDAFAIYTDIRKTALEHAITIFREVNIGSPVAGGTVSRDIVQVAAKFEKFLLDGGTS